MHAFEEKCSLAHMIAHRKHLNYFTAWSIVGCLTPGRQRTQTPSAGKDIVDFVENGEMVTKRWETGGTADFT